MSIKKNLLTCLFSSLFIMGVFGQNTLQYTEKEIDFKNGLELFEKRNYSAARHYFQSYIEQPPRSLQTDTYNRVTAEYYVVVCSMYLNYPEAELQAERFVNNHAEYPQATQLYRQLGLYYFEREDYNKAVTYLDKALASPLSDEDVLETNFKLGVSYYNLNSYAKALDVFSSIKRNNDATYGAAASYYAGHINFRNENYDDAVDDFRRIKDSPQYRSEIPSLVAQILYRQGKYEEMVAYTEPFLSQKGNPNGIKLEELALLTAEVYYHKGDFKKAGQYYTQYANFKSLPMTPPVRYRYGYSLYRNNDHKKAVEVFKAIAAGKDTLSQYAAYYLGITYLKTDAPTLSLAALDQARKLSYHTGVQEDAYFNHAKVLLELNRGTEAIKELNEFIDKYPNSKYEDEANELLSEAYLSSNDYAAAMKYIEGLKRRTARINTAYQRMAFNQGVYYFNGENYAEARKYFDKAIQTTGEADLKSSAQFWKAESFSAEKNYNDAILLYTSVIKSGNEESSTNAQYALGYAYYNTKDYTNALTQFKAYTEKLKGATDKKHYDDAIARMADCYFVNKNFAEANRLYDVVLGQGKADKDYALYQKALALEFQDKDQEAKNTYDKVVTLFPNSRYADDALFHLGMLEFNGGSYQVALRHFNRLIQDKPKSPLIAATLLKRAVAYTNVNMKEEAISDYKTIIDRYCDSKNAESAILGLQDLLNDVGRSDEYESSLAMYKKCNPSSGSLESIEFESAKAHYFNEKYDKAIQSLLSFMQSYPGSQFNYEGKYYLGDSYYRLSDKVTALRYYYQVIADNRTSFVSKSVSKAAEIEVSNKNYQKAAQNYRTLVSLATDKKEVVKAWTGLMEIHYVTAKYDSVLVYTREIINAGSVNLGAQNKALLYQGKVYEAKGELSKAIEEYNKTVSAAKDDIGAEAKYGIATIHFKTKKYEDCKKTCLDFNDQFPDNDKWKARVFLIYADACVATNDILQAKATLNSLIENADDKEVVAKAKEKLATLEKTK